MLFPERHYFTQIDITNGENMQLDDEPRLLPRIRRALERHYPGDDGSNRAETFTVPSDPAGMHDFVGTIDASMNKLYDEMRVDLPRDAQEPEMTPEEILIDGLDGNEVILYVFRAPGREMSARPAVVYVHGGGMIFGKTLARPHVRWCESLARRGCVVVAVDFRNAYTPEKHHPFPAGLNDCVAAVRYIAAHKTELGISKVVLEGESGGANLVLATALRAKREGWIDDIAGVFAYCPSIGGEAHSWSKEEVREKLPSMVENSRFILDWSLLKPLAEYYSPNDMRNSLAWPYWATETDVRGMPPHAFSFDELDPLRDEGVAYFRTMVAAGVDATADTNLGATHGSALVFRADIPRLFDKILGQVVAFVDGL